MPLKPKNPQTPSEPSSSKSVLSGPWGRISPEPQAVVALRLCKKSSSSTEETYSYPYRVLSSWHWRGGGNEEQLKIEASSDLVTVKGRGLERLVEALDRNALEILREEQNHSPSTPEDPIQILSISITKASDVMES